MQWNQRGIQNLLLKNEKLSHKHSRKTQLKRIGSKIT